MKRISRNKFLHPHDVRMIVCKLSKLSVSYAGCWGVVEKAAINYDCHFVGMINGEPPFCRILQPTAYMVWMQWLRDYKRSNRINYELQLLRVTMRYT